MPRPIHGDTEPVTINAVEPFTALAVTPEIEANINKRLSQPSLVSLFSEAPVLYQVAKCESHLRQFKADGTLLRGIVVSTDVGILQINEGYHAEEAKKLGYDLYTLQGNIDFGIWLYEKEGLTPWHSSEYCWGPAVKTA